MSRIKTCAVPVSTYTYKAPRIRGKPAVTVSLHYFQVLGRGKLTFLTGELFTYRSSFQIFEKGLHSSKLSEKQENLYHVI